jgi:hypothetical protein
MKFENGQTLLSWDFYSVASAVKPDFKNHERIDHVNGSGPLKSTIITKILADSLFEMEKILIRILWMKYQKPFRLAY